LECPSVSEKYARWKTRLSKIGTERCWLVPPPFHLFDSIFMGRHTKPTFNIGSHSTRCYHNACIPLAWQWASWKIGASFGTISNVHDYAHHFLATIFVIIFVVVGDDNYFTTVSLLECTTTTCVNDSFVWKAMCHYILTITARRYHRHFILIVWPYRSRCTAFSWILLCDLSLCSISVVDTNESGNSYQFNWVYENVSCRILNVIIFWWVLRFELYVCAKVISIFFILQS